MNEELALLTALVRQRAQEQNELDHQLVEAIEGIRARLAALEIQARPRVIPADQWPQCPFCDGRGGILHWRMVDEDEWEPQDEMCEGCDATGRISPSHLQEYELACASGRDDLELWRLPF